MSQIVPSVPHHATLPLRARLAMLARLLAIQASWNYELLLGNGIGFCAEPALRGLPGGTDGAAYHDALARESRYFNAHPYLAAIAVGALARAELDGYPPAQIERFRTALCGPLGSVGDRLVWAAWLPFCSFLALTAFGFGAGPILTLLIFLVVYNVGHLGLRSWGLSVGWRHGMRVAAALGNPVLRRGPEYIARAAALLAGVAIPLCVDRIIGPERGLAQGGGFAAAAVVGAILVALHGRVDGWRVAVGALAALALYAVMR
jgi:PTS system mannose-specific IID component